MGSLGQLHTAHFASLIVRYGELPHAWYRRVGPCPNPHLDQVGGFAPDGACALCDGSGTLWEEMALPTRGQSQGKLLLTSANRKNISALLEIAVGDLVCSYLEEDYSLAERDRLVLASREFVFTEKITRGSGAKDRLRHNPVTRVDRVFTAAGAVGSGYAVSGDALGVQWFGGPSVGTDYVIRYRYRPSYVVIGGSHLHRVEASNGDRFPSRVVLRVWHQGPLDGNDGQF